MADGSHADDGFAGRRTTAIPVTSDSSAFVTAASGFRERVDRVAVDGRQS